MEQAAPSWWETRWFAIVAILASCVPLLWPALPPLIDLPGHVGRFRVMLGTDTDVLGQWYHFQWRLIGNLGVDLLVAGIAPWIGLEPAVKLITIAIVTLSAAGILWIAREIHGRATPFALFALPLIYNYAFHFGFLNFALAMALALNGFALWLRLGRLGRTHLRAALFVPLALLVWGAHIMGWGVLGLMVFGAELALQRQKGSRWSAAAMRAALACLPLALPLLPMLLWRPDGGGGITERFFSPRKISWLAAFLRDRWWLFDFGAAALLWGLIYRSARDRRYGQAAPMVAACLVLLVAFVLIPYKLFGSAYADMRLAPFILLCALLAIRVDRIGARERQWLAIAGLAFFAARTAGTTISFWLYDREYARQLAALDHIPRGARVVSFVGEHCIEPWGLGRLNHLPAMGLVRRAAFSNDQWELAGSALLTVNVPAMGGFAIDPSEMVLAEPCEGKKDLITIDQSLRSFPRDAFDYVWLIAPPAFDARLLAGTTRVWQDGGSALYKIDRNRLSAGARPH
ncbi:hypothetical protein HZY97_10600 [Sphingomonas sp. R-74633]|uniref:hypothetical protein n=1 Tax=Sphingomonas sp. R-74633 TaxID=2751188 RepID=UPI0015D294B3|nr:hypothetical protein [Sphingomonas sp. R-74633]NYT41207.1 hypothetical protein [Sphingomonas sp. R-74633]